MRKAIHQILKVSVGEAVEPEVAVSEQPAHGHYSTNAALRIATRDSRNPLEVARELAAKIARTAPAGFFEKVEIAPPGFVNLWLSHEAIQAEFARIAAAKEYGILDLLRGTRVMIEYTDPNPFKQFHIGHLMTNVIGESLARLHEAAGAEVLRVNYQGDVGIHVASSIWGMKKLAAEMPRESVSLADKTAFLGRAYAEGATAYSKDLSAKTEIEALNKKIYERSDPEINKLYDLGRRWSLDYFETLYARLGTKFVHYFFEREAGLEGVAIVKAHPEVFIESKGAIIFPGEQYGLHNRVFVNAQGLPTYEAKELGVNTHKFKLYRPDISFIVTGNEINEYFRVVLKAMEFIAPEVAAKTKHIGHGMLRLPAGKMSSRTGEVITAESLIDMVKRAVGEKLDGREDLSEEEKETIKEQVALAAIRYSVLKQGIGKDIIFDLERATSLNGNSGPYLQYTSVRLSNILRKAGATEKGDPRLLVEESELTLILKLSEFPYAIEQAVGSLAPNAVAFYLYELANLANRFYETTPVLQEKNTLRRNARLTLVHVVAAAMKRGLWFLGISSPEKM